jgi:hypothetical protein
MMPLLPRSLFLSMFVIIAGSNAHADEPFTKPASVEARDRLSRGNNLYRVGDFEKAIEEYEAGAVVEPVPIFEYNLGQCYRQLGEYDAAKRHYERFLSGARPQGEVLEAVESFITQMDAERERTRASQPVKDPVPASTSVVAPPASAAAATTSAISPVPSTVSVAEPWYADGIGWGVAGTGVAGMGLAAALFVNAKTVRDDANTTADPMQRHSLLREADTSRRLGTVIAIGAVGVFVTGIVKLALHESNAGQPTAWNIGISRGAVTLQTRF